MTQAFDEYVRVAYAGKAEAYARSYASLCAAPAGELLDAAEVTAGTALLDVGTGTGTVARLALNRGARVAAVDAERSMVETTRAHVPDVRLGSLPDLPFLDGAFDAVVANFVVNHVADPVASLAGMARVARPGGTVAVTIWSGTSTAASTFFGDAMEAAGVPQAAAPRLDPAHDFARTRDGLAGVLSAAGLDEVAAREVFWVHRVDPEVWWSGPASGVAGMGWQFGRQPAEAVERIKTAYDRIVAPHRAADGLLEIPVTAILAGGRVPAATA